MHIHIYSVYCLLIYISFFTNTSPNTFTNTSANTFTNTSTKNIFRLRNIVARIVAGMSALLCVKVFVQVLADSFEQVFVKVSADSFEQVFAEVHAEVLYLIARHIS